MIRIDGFLMDLALSESHSFPGEVTQYPVEQGADISDHIRDLPNEIELECIVSDTPIGIVPLLRDGPDAGPDGETPLPSAAALEHLRTMKSNRLPVVIQTSLGVFTDMVCIGLDIPKDAGKSNALFFTAKFKHVTIVTNKRTKTRVKSQMAGAGGRAKPKAQNGVPIKINNVIQWFHGLPPGTPWRAPNKIEQVRVAYNKPAGLTNDEMVQLGFSDPGSPLISYFHIGGTAGAESFIFGSEYDALVADLRRDQQAQIAKKRAKFNALSPAEQDAAVRRDENLPPNTSTLRWTEPDPNSFSGKRIVDPNAQIQSFTKG